MDLFNRKKVAELKAAGKEIVAQFETARVNHTEEQREWRHLTGRLFRAAPLGFAGYGTGMFGRDRNDLEVFVEYLEKEKRITETLARVPDCEGKNKRKK